MKQRPGKEAFRGDFYFQKMSKIGETRLAYPQISMYTSIIKFLKVMDMKNSKIPVIVPCVLALVFLAAGLWMMLKSYNQMTYYSAAIRDAQQALQEADPAQAEGAEQEAQALQAENEQLRQQVAALQEENAALDEQTRQLQSSYDELVGQEDTAYYQKILESLTEGMNQVEEYIRGS